MPSSKELRDHIFKNEPRRETLVVDGVTYEVREPTFSQVKSWVQDEPDPIDILIAQVYNPETGQRVFDPYMKKTLAESLGASHPMMEAVEIVRRLVEQGYNERDSGAEEKQEPGNRFVRLMRSHEEVEVME